MGWRMSLERYTIPDIAAALDVRPNTVSGYRSRKQMPAPTGMVGRTPYWSARTIEPWIEQQRTRRKHVGRSRGLLG